MGGYVWGISTPDAFESTFASGVAALRSGTHGIEGDPRSTGRWGPSIVLLPDAELARRLAEVTTSASEAIDGVHWHSGGLGRAHLTVRALEPHAEAIEPVRLQRYRAATQRALRGVGPLRFRFRGLGISAGSLMVRAEPLTPAADLLRERLGAELGGDGWLEAAVFENGRDPIWYSSILHYAELLTDVDGLVAWVSARSDLSLGVHTFESLEICWWKHDGHGMAPQVVASLPVNDQSFGTDDAPAVRGP